MDCANIPNCDLSKCSHSEGRLYLRHRMKEVVSKELQDQLSSVRCSGVGSYLLLCASVGFWGSVLLQVSAAPNSLAQRSRLWPGLSARTRVVPCGLSLSSLCSSCLLHILIWDQLSALFWLQSTSSNTFSIMGGVGHHPGAGANSWLMLRHLSTHSCVCWWGTLACEFGRPPQLPSAFLSACSNGQLVARRAEHDGGGDAPPSSGHSCLLRNSRGSSSKLRSKGSAESGCSRSNSSWNRGWHGPSDMDKNPQEW